MIYINLLIIFLFLVFIHEFGHYLTARFFGLKVTDFSVGFGKTLFQYKDRNNTNWKLSLIPLGGFVKIKGLESIFLHNKISDLEVDSFNYLKLYQKIIILLAGSFFNIISAWICLFCILFFFGLVSFPPEVGKVIKNSAADINDIRVGDVITKVNNNDIYEFQDIAHSLKNQSKYISIELVRNNKFVIKDFELQYNEELNRYLIGISSINDPEVKKFIFMKSFLESIYFIPNYYIATYYYLLSSINNNTIVDEISGPIGIIKVADELMLDKIKGVMILFIMISLFVALFNLLPIPLLDGGHILYFILRSIFADSLPHIITRIYLFIGISIISFLFLFVTLNDIFNK